MKPIYLFIALVLFPLMALSDPYISDELMGYWEDEEEKYALYFFQYGFAWIDICEEDDFWLSYLPSTANYELITAKYVEDSVLISASSSFFGRKINHSFDIHWKGDSMITVNNSNTEENLLFYRKDPAMHLKTYLNIFGVREIYVGNSFKELDLHKYVQLEKLEEAEQMYLLGMESNFGFQAELKLFARHFNLGHSMYDIEQIYTYPDAYKGNSQYFIIGKNRERDERLAISLSPTANKNQFWLRRHSFSRMEDTDGLGIKVERFENPLTIEDLDPRLFKSYYGLGLFNGVLPDISNSIRVNANGRVELLGDEWKVLHIYSKNFQKNQRENKNPGSYEVYVELENLSTKEYKLISLGYMYGEPRLMMHEGSYPQRYRSFAEVFEDLAYLLLFMLMLMAIGFVLLYRIFFLPRKLKQQLSQVQLEGIKSQLNPHFLFNSISSIQSLMNQGKTEKANTYLNDFSDLLRYHLDEGAEDLVLLSEELSALQHYCQLEQLRSPFQFSIEVDTQLNPEHIELPTQILQIIVENSIKHGLRLVTDPELTIRLQKMDQYLRISIADNGPGIHAQSLKNASLLTKRKTHKGLELIREKIKLLKKKGIKLKMEIKDRKIDLAQSQNGTLVNLDIPLNY